MENVPIGVTIKTLVQKNNLSVKILADKLNLTRQAVYAAYQRTSMHEGELKRWADAMNVTIQELKNPDFKTDSTNREIGSFGEAALKRIQTMLEEELKEKNEQIRALQKALEQAQSFSTALLGKSPEHLDADVLPLWPNGFQHASA